MFLRRGIGITRVARLTDSDWKPLAERPYMITNKGIEDIPETEAGKKLLEKTEDYEKKQSEALKDPRGKKTTEEAE
jgi:hypothetical protein